MITDFFTMYAWVFWVALLLVFVIVEVLTVDFTFLMLAGGCVGGLIADLLGAPFWAQILLAGMLSLLFLFIARPAIKRSLGRGSDATPTNVAALIGAAGTVTTPFVDGQGHVKLSNGETWTARLSRATTNRPVDTGERIVVTAIEGATAIVAPSEGTAL
jgi:membrane protein implicated in regulation of membrane protease activity